MKALLWKVAKKSDDHFQVYSSRKPGVTYPPIERLPTESRDLIYKILDVEPERRPYLPEILSDPWIKQIEMCSPCHTTVDSDSRFFHRHRGPVQQS